MVAIMQGRDIIESIRGRHARKAKIMAGDAMGVFGSFCKGIRVTKSANGGPSEVVALATTDDLDLDGERVMPEGADWSYLNANGNLFLDHCYSSTQAVARLRSMSRTGNGWLCRAALLPDPDNEYVRCVKVLAEAGGLGMSIGFKVLDGGAPTPDELVQYPGTRYMIRKWLGVEVSYTAMPCNVACQTQALIYGDDSTEKAARARGLLTKSKVPEALWGAVGLAVEAKLMRSVSVVMIDGFRAVRTSAA